MSTIEHSPHSPEELEHGLKHVAYEFCNLESAKEHLRTTPAWLFELTFVSFLVHWRCLTEFFTPKSEIKSPVREGDFRAFHFVPDWAPPRSDMRVEWLKPVHRRLAHITNDRIPGLSDAPAINHERDFDPMFAEVQASLEEFQVRLADTRFGPILSECLRRRKHQLQR